MSHRIDLPPVLQDVSIQIPAGSKVGILGRTGAGKSSLLQALFRLAEPSGERQGDSCIFIDGRDIQRMGLLPLRRHALSLIPQTPFLFTGTLRENLDPFNSFTDG